jgi:hypothetical protein
MSPIVEIRNGIKEYKSNIYKIGEAPLDVYEKDDKLNALIEKELEEVVLSADPKELKRNKVNFYWRTGSLLREILYNSGLVEKEDKDLFFQNVSIHMKKYDCYPKNDPSKNRFIPEQLFRLSSYSEKVANKAIWTAWSYIFDSPIFSRKGIDGVLEGILDKGDYEFNQEFSRAWSQVFTYLFKNIDPSNWTDEEFSKPVFCTLEILRRCQNNGFDLTRKESRSIIIKGFENSKDKFVQLKKGIISSEDYIDIILRSIFNKT